MIFNEKNKLAIVILAHKNENQLKFLVDALKHKSIDIYIHFDQKWLNQNPIIVNLFKNKKNVFVNAESFDCILDDWSIPEATLSTLSFAYENSRNLSSRYSYYYLISGQDFPIKPLKSLLDFLSFSYPKPLIDVTPYDSKNWLKNKFNKNFVFFSLNILINRKIKSKFLRRSLKIFTFFMDFIFGFFNYGFKKSKKMKLKLYGGSSWWCLPDVLVLEILNEWKNKESKVIGFFKKTFTPEETFFQTMIMKSNLSQMVKVNDILERKQNSPTYANFSNNNEKFTGHPYIFTNIDFKRLINLNEFFARKFDEKIDKLILSRLFDYIKK
jgi:hypothetical protein